MSLRERLAWAEGAVHDGPRRYVLMRPDVLMGAVALLDEAPRAALLEALAASTARHGADSLRAYSAQVGGDGDALAAATVDAAAGLGWGRWELSRNATGLQLEVHGSPFAAGFTAAAGSTAAHPVCAPIRGMLQALAGLLLGQDVHVAEHDCTAANAAASCCRFHATAP